MTQLELKQRRDEIIARHLAIRADLAASKKAFAFEGVERPFRERAALDSEYADLAVELHGITAAIKVSEKAEKVLRDASFHATLLRILRERGHDQIIADAFLHSRSALLECAKQGVTQ